MSIDINSCEREGNRECPHCCSHCCSCNICPACRRICCGPTGPTGPTGPAGGEVFLNGFHAQLGNRSEVLLGDRENILFDSVINGQSTNISYDNSTGEFMLYGRKNYYISWWAVVNGSEVVPMIEMAVAVNYNPVAVVSSPQVTGQLSGTALISVIESPGILSIMNVSGDSVRYAAASIQASIVILELAGEG